MTTFTAILVAGYSFQTAPFGLRFIRFGLRLSGCALVYGLYAFFQAALLVKVELVLRVTSIENSKPRRNTRKK